MTKEALKLALEALQNPWKVGPDGVADAIIAIKEVLAQPEQERFLVATIGNWGRVEWADGVFPSLGDKMYSAPRTWVGLTDEEVKQLCLAAGTEPIEVRLIEAKLKGKNT